VRLLFAGVRGSMPVSGAQFHRVGGHTSCVAVQHDREPLPALILDAGAGITNLAAQSEGAPFIDTIMLTHLHCDHVQGLVAAPFPDRARRAGAPSPTSPITHLTAPTRRPKETPPR
jgi:phosphoribosyl 1,2-cyclic phosphodiesterase